MFHGVILVDCINCKSTAHNGSRSRFSGRDIGAAGNDSTKDIPLTVLCTAVELGSNLEAGGGR
jgi:hypothetical protein